MKPCLHCEGKGYVITENDMLPDDIKECIRCEDGLVFESEEEKRLYEVLMK